MSIELEVVLNKNEFRELQEKRKVEIKRIKDTNVIRLKLKRR